MSTEVIIIFAISIVFLYIKLGANQAMKITRTLNDGFLPAWFFTLGATSTVILYFIIAVLGAEITQNFLSYAIFFKIISGAYLLYLGYKGLSNIEKGVCKGRTDKSNKHKFFENYMIGVVMTLANPITIFYFVGIMLNITPLESLTTQGIIVGICVIAFVGNFIDIILILLVSQIKKALISTPFVKKINIVSSIGFILIGAFFLYSAFFMDNYLFTIR